MRGSMGEWEIEYCEPSALPSAWGNGLFTNCSGGCADQERPRHRQSVRWASRPNPDLPCPVTISLHALITRVFLGLISFHVTRADLVSHFYSSRSISTRAAMAHARTQSALLLLLLTPTSALFNGSPVGSSSDVPGVTGSLFLLDGGSDVSTCTSGDTTT